MKIATNNSRPTPIIAHLSHIADHHPGLFGFLCLVAKNMDLIHDDTMEIIALHVGGDKDSLCLDDSTMAAVLDTKGRIRLAPAMTISSTMTSTMTDTGTKSLSDAEIRRLTTRRITFTRHGFILYMTPEELRQANPFSLVRDRSPYWHAIEYYLLHWKEIRDEVKEDGEKASSNWCYRAMNDGISLNEVLFIRGILREYHGIG